MPDDVIRTKRLDLVDDAGQTRASLSTGGGETSLTFLNREGHPALGIGVNDDVGTPGASMFDERGTVRVFVDLDADGSPAAVLYDIAGEPRMALGVGEDGASAIDFTGPFGESRITLEFDEIGQPGLVIMDGSGSDRVAITVYKDGEPHIDFLDPDGKVTKWPV